MVLPQINARRWWVIVAGLGLGVGLIMSPNADSAQLIRVLLSADVKELEVTSNQTIWATDQHDRAWSYHPTVQITVRDRTLLVNGQRMPTHALTLRAGGQDLKLWMRENDTRNQLHAVAEKDALQVSGVIRLLWRGKKLLLINSVELEEYVKGVVPAEVNSAWHLEMLKTQAVVARTYALYQHMLSISRDYDVVAGFQDQVFRGRRGIDTRVAQAVDATRGLVVTHKGAPIYAAFSLTSAGATEDAMNVWSKDLPYLKGVECPFDIESPFYQWKASFNLETLERNLRKHGFSLGTIREIAPLTYSRAGRVATLQILHSNGELVIRGEDLRRAVGYMVVPSTQFKIESIGQVVNLSGYGAGHGVGLCQRGAKELADLGYSFKAILSYYYPGTELLDLSLTQPPPDPSASP